MTSYRCSCETGPYETVEPLTGQVRQEATIAGSASFTLCRNRAGDPIQTWQADEGSLVLLRGLGLAANPDGRPMHLVGGPTGAPRTSIGIRMDTA